MHFQKNIAISFVWAAFSISWFLQRISRDATCQKQWKTIGSRCLFSKPLKNQWFHQHFASPKIISGVPRRPQNHKCAKTVGNHCFRNILRKKNIAKTVGSSNFCETWAPEKGQQRSGGARRAQERTQGQGSGRIDSEPLVLDAFSKKRCYFSGFSCFFDPMISTSEFQRRNMLKTLKNHWF